ncbi:MAG: phosphatase PAP2 family protein [Thermomicrobiales bacterium]
MSTSIHEGEGFIFEPDSRQETPLPEQGSYGPLIGVFVAIYFLIATSMYFIRGGNVITPDKWLIALFLGAVFLGKGVKFLRDWIPFLLLLFGYEFMRGIAGDVTTSQGLEANQHGRVQVDWLVHGDRWLFGGTDPAPWLQQKLYTPGQTHWYDAMAAIVYLMHFVLPLVFAFALWMRRRDQFWEFTIALLVMSYTSFIFFILVPTAPPWLASYWGKLDGLQHPSDAGFKTIMPARYSGLNTFSLWTHHSPNPVAALPSLHAAFPWLVMLFAVRFFGRVGWALMIYNAMLWFTVVYLGQHWIIDIVAGIIWASVSYVVIVRVWPACERRWVARQTARSGALPAGSS